MVKKIRNISLLFILSFLSFNIRAYGTVLNHATTYGNVGLNLSGNNASQLFPIYRDERQNSYYCLDPQLDAELSYLVPARKLLSGSSERRKAADAAMLAIMSADDKSNQTYWVVLTALRALNYTFGYSKENMGGPWMAATWATWNLTIAWNNAYSSEINEINHLLALKGETTPVALSSNITSSGEAMSYSFTGNPLLITQAGNLFQRGLQAAINYLKNTNDQSSITARTVMTYPKEYDPETDIVKQDMLHTIELKDYTNTSSFVINPIVVNSVIPTSVAYTITEIKVDDVVKYDRTTTGNAVGVNLVQTGDITPGNHIVTIRVHFEGKKESIECDKNRITYTLGGTGTTTGFTSTEGTSGYIYQSAENKQDMATADINRQPGDNQPTINNVVWTSPYTFDLLDDCEEPPCDPKTDPDCPCDPEDPDCPGPEEPEAPKCDTFYSAVNDCCEDTPEKNYKYEDSVYEIKGVKPDSIKYCFVDSAESSTPIEDEKGNSYTYKKNSYCSINCREDYTITLPGAKRVISGRYFNFKANIKFAKSCYTSKIKRDKFKEDINNISAELVAAVNDYNKYYAVAHATIIPEGTIDIETCTSDGDGCNSCGSTAVVGHLNATARIEYSYNSVILSEADSTGFRKRVSTRQTNDSEKNLAITYSSSCGSNTSPTYEEDEDGNRVMVCSGCSSFSYTSGGVDPVDLMEEYQGEATRTYQQAERTIISKTNELEQKIREYKECSDWDPDYDFKPSFTYNYYDGTNNYDSSQPQDMDSTDLKINDINFNYCNYELTENYGNAKVTDNKYTECNGSGFGDNKEDTITIPKCSGGGGNYSCETTNKTISLALFVYSTIGGNGNYEPKELYYNNYPSGNISKDSNDKDNSTAVDKLPTNLSTGLGVYNYNIYISNIGQFYDQSNKYGRFIGRDNSVIKQTETFTCSYLVNIPEDKMYDIVCDKNPCENGKCVTECVGGSCDLCEDGNCVADCVEEGCVYNEDTGSSTLSRTVSLNEMFPNGTQAVNWNEATNEKARDTIAEIESKKNEIYAEEPILSLTITPSSASEIRSYNSDHLELGGYSNNTISCQNIDGNGTTYEQIACYSSFIDELLQGKYGNNIVNDKSTIGNSRDNVNTYFKLWTGEIADTNMIGPSWK